MFLSIHDSIVEFDGNDVVDDVLDYLQPQEAPHWDPQFCGDDLTLRDSNRTVFKEARTGYGPLNQASYFGGGVQSALPCSRYSVQLVKGQNFMIGFAPRHGFQKNRVNYATCGWFLSVDDGRLWSQDGTWNKAYGSAIPEGSTVTAIHDTHRRTIEFQVDGNSLGIAFTNIPHENLYAAADFRLFSDIDDDIRIMNGY